jgi:hypothetical protein
MGAAQGRHPRELVWTVVGASAGSLARYWLDPTAHGIVRSLAGMFALAGLSAALIGFAVVATCRAALKTVLLAAGGAAGSVGAAAERAAVGTPTQSALGLAAFGAGAVLGC